VPGFYYYLKYNPYKKTDFGYAGVSWSFFKFIQVFSSHALAVAPNIFSDVTITTESKFSMIKRKLYFAYY
jgi:hypothetical protein